MADRSAQRSPLALVVLACLFESPMHAYRMHELIKQRGKDSVVNVAQRNSVYQTIARLLRTGLISVQQTSRDEGRPERVVYQLTESGSAALHRWIKDMLAEPGNEFPEFPAALAHLMLLTPEEATLHLQARHDALAGRLQQSEAAMQAVLASGLPRLFLIEDEYKQAMLRAELAWLAQVLDELRTKRLTWSEAWLRRVAAQMGAGA